METLLLLTSTLGGGLCAVVAMGLAAVSWTRTRALRGDHAALADRLAAAQATAPRLEAERTALAAERDALRTERDALAGELAAARLAMQQLEDAQAGARRREQAILEVQEVFLARMSHELRTPLNAVTGYCELLLEDATGDVRADLERIRIAAANLGALVTSVLDLSELQSGDFAIKPEVLRVDELVAQVVDACRFVAEQQRDSIEVDVEQGLVVVVDKRMLSSVLFHLTSNACKFTMKGVVRLTARSAQPNLQGVPTDALELVVSDTGIGMTPRQIEAAFLPFAQGDDSFTRRYDGGGVGLAVVNGFVRAMGGEVAITSVPGSGATITVLLPKEVRARNESFGDDEDTVLLR